ncbi:MAG: NAD-dependent epimerase/dehydratase family protein, partial [Devosia sp.]
GGVGRAIIKEARAQGHELVCIDRVAAPETEETRDLHFIQADMDEYEKLVAAFAGCDALIHMAAIPSPGRHPDHIVHNNNVVGSYNALQAAVDNGIMRICQASSVNAIGHSYSRDPHYDYLPIDEEHANYSEEPYSLSKWICEAQADAFARRWDDISIASMRFHWVVPERDLAARNFTPDAPNPKKHLFAYTRFGAAARACLLGLEGKFKGHEAFYIVAPDTTLDIPSREAAAKFFPGIAIKGELSGRQAFFNSSKAERILGWKHDL